VYVLYISYLCTCRIVCMSYMLLCEHAVLSMCIVQSWYCDMCICYVVRCVCICIMWGCRSGIDVCIVLYIGCRCMYFVLVYTRCRCMYCVVLYTRCRCMYFLVVYTGCRCMYCVVLCTWCRCMCSFSGVDECIAWCCMFYVVL